MTIRPTTYEDLPRVMEILRQGREKQLESGNLNQWPQGYPREDMVQRDIERGASCVIERDGEIVGTFALIFGIDPTYLVIENGAWIDSHSPYATIHRIAGIKSVHGIWDTAFAWCSERCRNIRIDTHPDNAAMRHCIEKSGFVYCGIIHILSGAERMAFQWLGEPRL